MEKKQLIATIRGKAIYTNEELLISIIDSFPNTEYVDVNEIDSISVLEESLGSMEYYYYQIESLIDSIKERITDLEVETEEENN
jgi:hypothetical protein